jgi:hypothetical protein
VSGTKRVLVQAGVWLLYTACLLWAYPRFGPQVLALSALPVAIGAALEGPRAGVGLALGSGPYHVGLMLAIDPPFAASYLAGDGLFGTLVLIAVGGLVGWMRDVNRELRRELARRSSVVRFARRAAAETDPDRLLGALLDEARCLVGADGGTVRRWDEPSRTLVPIRSTFGGGQVRPLGLGQGIAGRAAARREPVVIADRSAEPGTAGWDGSLRSRSGIAVPVFHEGQLLGVLSVANLRRRARFAAGDVEAIEILASIAAAALAGLERSRLAGALLAARTAQHEMRNAISAAVACAALIADDPGQPGDLRLLAEEALRGTTRASGDLERLGRLTRIREREWGPEAETTIDLVRSAV